MSNFLNWLKIVSQWLITAAVVSLVITITANLFAFLGFFFNLIIVAIILALAWPDLFYGPTEVGAPEDFEY